MTYLYLHTPVAGWHYGACRCLLEKWRECCTSVYRVRYTTSCLTMRLCETLYSRHATVATSWSIIHSSSDNCCNPSYPDIHETSGYDVIPVISSLHLSQAVCQPSASLRETSATDLFWASFGCHGIKRVGRLRGH